MKRQRNITQIKGKTRDTEFQKIKRKQANYLINNDSKGDQKP